MYSRCTHSSDSQYAPGAYASPNLPCPNFDLLPFRIPCSSLSRSLPILFRGRYAAMLMLGFSCTEPNGWARYIGVVYANRIGSSPVAPLLWAEYSPTDSFKRIKSIEMRGCLTISPCLFAHRNLLNPSSSAVHRHSLCPGTAQPRTAPWYQPGSPISMRCHHLRHLELSTIHRGGQPRLMRSAA